METQTFYIISKIIVESGYADDLAENLCIRNDYSSSFCFLIVG
jgi:hypothetical protein